MAVISHITDAIDALDSVPHVIKLKARGSTSTAVRSIRVGVDGATNGVRAGSATVGKRRLASLHLAIALNALGLGIGKLALRTASTTVVEGVENVNLTTVRVVVVTVVITSTAGKRALATGASSLVEVASGISGDLTVLIAVTAVVLVIERKLATVLLVVIAILVTSVALFITAQTTFASRVRVLDVRALVSTGTTILRIGFNYIRTSDIALVKGGVAKIVTILAFSHTSASIALNINNVERRVGALVITSTTRVHSIQRSLTSISGVIVAITVARGASIGDVANTVVTSRDTAHDIGELVAIVVARTTSSNVIKKSLATKLAIAISIARVA